MLNLHFGWEFSEFSRRASGLKQDQVWAGIGGQDVAAVVEGRALAVDVAETASGQILVDDLVALPHNPVREVAVLVFDSRRGWSVEYDVGGSLGGEEVEVLGAHGESFSCFGCLNLVISAG